MKSLLHYKLKILVLVCCVSLPFTSFAQEKYKEVHINTTFKGNDIYKDMAYAILEAVKIGRLPMYTPLNKKKRTTFETLMYQLRGWTFMEIDPNEQYCSTTDINEASILFEQDYLLFYDDSNVLHTIHHSPVYIQFTILSELSGHAYDVLGPIFYFDDIKKAKLKLKGSDQFLHEMILNHQYQGYEVREDGKHVPFHSSE
ncbi:hypothetical protein [Flammeovirga sp. EKP202]|uniref:hypothetical protein n=1 Tax=Flammeovirga sp. EKP202 TaxID=2770592 RepID=UPI00165FC320|nr:hypothetical protein [Flammeovirga sp. EKP202]MBD0401371.1 hypothetical protein [Flammeovirga sp. EKP202]